MSTIDIAALVSKIKAHEVRKRGKPVMVATVESFGKDIIEELAVGIEFNMRDPEVIRFVENWSAKRVTKMNRTTRKRLAKLLATSVENGEGVNKIRKRIGKMFRDMSKGRALTIARTEVARASNFGSLRGLIQAEVPSKEWLTVVDVNTRATHLAMDGQLRRTSEPFESPSGAKAQYPGDFGIPKEDIACRCGVVASFKKIRKAQMKNLEARRAPFDRRMVVAMRGAFAAQKEAVLSALPDAA